MEIDGNMLKFCSPSHANTGEANWDEKKNLNIRMGVPTVEQEEQFEGDNLMELSGGGE